jgi:hypothetical protein
MACDSKDMECIESLVDKNAEDILGVLATRFERLEEYLDDMESRLAGYFVEIEDKLDLRASREAPNV